MKRTIERIRRRCFTVAAAVPFVLFIAAAGLWMRTYIAADAYGHVGQVQTARGGGISHWILQTTIGEVQLLVLGELPPPQSSLRPTTKPLSNVVVRVSNVARILQGWRHQPPFRRRPELNGWHGFEWKFSPPDPYRSGMSLLLPCWALAAMFSVLPAVWAIRHLRRSRLPGLCATCGYNLTGNTSGVCPECGREIRTPKRERTEHV
jgi:predicted RNA-binding Zn-ribbon protein involved in translation (DUF1610 family)